MLREDFNQINDILEFIIKDPQSHGRWLNTISYLKYIAAKKIVSSQSESYIDETTLRHVAEEIRHALFLKNLIAKIGLSLPNYEYENLYCGFSFFRYFQSIDILVQKELLDIDNDKEYLYLCYLYVSHLIEERANWLYHKYNSTLQRNNSSFALISVILEEARHLEMVQELLPQHDSAYHERIQRLNKEEASLFDRFYLTLLRCTQV